LKPVPAVRKAVALVRVVQAAGAIAIVAGVVGDAVPAAVREATVAVTPAAEADAAEGRNCLAYGLWRRSVALRKDPIPSTSARRPDAKQLGF